MTEAVLPEILHMAAFADGPGGGNMAGVVLDAVGLDDAQMQKIAKDLGYSETAFVTSHLDAERRGRIRYFSPGAEVPFCGHATVATAVALAERFGAGQFMLDTSVGQIALDTAASEHGMEASFTSVEPRVTEFEPEVLQRLLGLLSLDSEALHPDYPARLSFTGNIHPMVVLRETNEFDAFDFDAGAMRALMDEQGWAGTVTVLCVLGPEEFETRNLFPVGNIREDPATGSAAASTGAYLRAIGALDTPASVLIHQGRHVGRPSILRVSIPATGGITVSGTATHTL